MFFKVLLNHISCSYFELFNPVQLTGLSSIPTRGSVHLPLRIQFILSELDLGDTYFAPLTI